jgi:hypothetical protein
MLRNLFAVCLLAMAGQANAGLMLVTATSLHPFTSDFSVTFNDTGNELLELAEVTAFSGMTQFGVLYPELIGVRGPIPGITSGGGFGTSDLGLPQSN